MRNTGSQPKTVLSDRVDDVQLAADAAAGDYGAFETIMRRHNRLLFRAARSILKNDEDAEDAVQEAYLRAFHALKSFRAEARLSTWLVRIAVNEALGRLHKRSSADVIPLDSAMEAAQTDTETEAWMERNPDDQPESVAARAELRKLIEARIDKLPEVFRPVFVLRAVEELTVEEVLDSLAVAPLIHGSAPVQAECAQPRSVCACNLSLACIASASAASSPWSRQTSR